MIDGISNDAKVGYPRTQSTRLQVIKDVEPMQFNKIDGVNWGFYRNALTGKIGSSGPLADFCNQSNIRFVLHY